MFVHILTHELFQRGGTLTTPFLSEVLTKHHEAGLRFVGVYTPHGRLVGAAGSPVGGLPSLEPDLLSAEIDTPLLRGRRVRMVSKAPRPRGPRPPTHPPSTKSLVRMQRPFPVLVLEFEPLMANELRSGTAWNLGISVATAVLLMSLALLLLRWIIHREALERRLEHSRRLADLGEMSAVLAHEIRNPLAALKGHAQLLVETLPAASRELAKAHRVVGEAERLESLTSDLLELVRSGNIERAPCDPTLLLQECASSLAEDRFEIHADHAPPSWSLDARRMGQVLTNLLQNALQASPVDRRVKVFVTVEERSLLYVVRDHGEGIPPGENERLFEPFHTTRTRGTGLGLAVARRMVALHGGSITASSHPKGGACFRVTIPKEQTQNGSNPGGR